MNSSLQNLLRYVPALESLQGYSPVLFRRDLFAGLTVAAVAVPQAMAYASIFGMPVEYGLYTAIVMTGVGALFDSSKQLINGPTNAISIAMLSALANVPEEARIPAAISMAMMIGLIQIGITMMRLGDLSRYISNSVVVGFTLGASVLLVLDQLKNVLGLTAIGGQSAHFVVRFWRTMTEGGPISVPTLAIALCTIAIALGLRATNRRLRWAIPELLVSIIAAGLIAWYFDLAQSGVKLVGAIPRSLPRFQLPSFDWEQSTGLLSSASAIGLLGLLEAIAMAKSIAAKTRQRLDINQQCLSEGLANLAGSFFQCFPGSGSLTRSYINHQAGAATQWSGVISALAVALTILIFAPFAQYVPRAALAGVLLLAATRMIEVPRLLYHFRATRFDAVIVVATALSAVAVSVEFCIFVGVLLSCVLYMPRASRVEVTELVVTEKGMIRSRATDDAACKCVRIFNFEGELVFGASPELEKHLEMIELKVTEQTKSVVLRVRHLRTPDAVCLELLDDFVDRMRERNVAILFSGVRKGLLHTLERVGTVGKIGPENVFSESSRVWSSTSDALARAYALLPGTCCDRCPRPDLLRPDHDLMHHMV